MCDPGKTVDLVRAVVEATRLPVTVKMRLGWDDDNWSAPFFAREFEQAGVAAVIVHGRTRAQGFSGRVNLNGIRAVVDAVERIPIIGNGDIRTIADADKMRTETACAGVSIGRGALLNPWIFFHLQNWESTGQPGDMPSYKHRLDFMDRHFHLLVEQRGERFACLTFRKVANWYCKVLKPGREVQQQLVKIESAEYFEETVARLRRQGAPASWQPHFQPLISVPDGPIAHW
jgi:nifR3 family TIM-barrel protein